jgi:hypothetical protein
MSASSTPPSTGIAAPPENGNGTQPPDDSAVLDALVMNGAITLDSFTADPATVTPCGGPPSTLRWQITEHADRATTDPERRQLRNVGFRLKFGFAGDLPVDLVGSRAVQPSLALAYTLSAALSIHRVPLGTVMIRTDESACPPPTTVTADQLRPLVEAAAQQFVLQQGARLRSPADLDISENGIHIHLAITRPGTIDVDVDVDVVFQLFPNNCGIQATYSRYNVDADIPWWLYLFDPVLVGIIEAFLSDIIGNQLRSALLNQVQSFLNGFIPPNLCVCRVTLADGQFSVLACPR